MDQQLIRLDYGHRTVRLDYLQQQRSKNETNSKICLLQRPVPKTCLLQQPTKPNRPPSCVAPVSSHPGAATSVVPYCSPFTAVNLRWRRQQRWVLAVPAAPHHGHSSPHWLRPIAVTPHHASPIPPPGSAGYLRRGRDNTYLRFGRRARQNRCCVWVFR